MAWFRGKLPDLDVLKSNDFGQKFHGRVLEFFDKNCTNQFFMIWFSPARKFGPREFLTVESLMKANPQACLMILSRTLDSRRGHKILKPLLDRGLKIVAVTPDVPFLLKNTPAEAWLEELKSGNKDPGKYPLYNNLSNLIRLAILYRYGGVYLDTDFIVLRNFTGLRNAVGVQVIDPKTKKWSSVNNALMIFDISHPILVEFLREFATTFDGNMWGHNGPYMLSRVIKRPDVGGANTTPYNITILPIKAFYPVDWFQMPKLYKKPTTEQESKRAEETVAELNRDSYALHLWNKETRGLIIEEGSVVQRIIASHCLICRDTYNSSIAV
ncbi:lactosylceramide 4-alpha-galactosyltransferase-like [Mangifera indica]|uniref:lactosylceramide 4-alpha-galactosyltransferase-like n=1 Tax=Mangifera indica TaxID=29780 RepID=UPI001CFB8665|nr:lactosylceramide 4-alpha-galactosyltransferase-like [Mangifera indica]